MYKQLAFASLILASSAACAQHPPAFYAGADFGSTKADDVPHRHGFGAFAGYNINANVAVEAGYHRLAKMKVSEHVDLGAPDYDFDITGSGKTTQLALSVVGTLPLGSGFSVYGRLGVNRLEMKGSSTVTRRGVSTFESDSESENKVLYGLGVSYAVTPAIAARFEVQKPHDKLTRAALGVSYAF